jgi:hypothetical protein
MSKIINLPSGATATIKDPRSLKQKDRKRTYVDTKGEPTMASGIAMMDNLIAVLIEEWSFDLIIPSVRLESLDELDIADYDMLQEEAEAALPLLFPRINKSVENEADPKASTDNSKG